MVLMMLMIATLLYLLTAAGIALLAAKYAFGPIPAPHHAAMLAKAGEAPGEATLRVMAALYRVMAGALFGGGLAVLVLAWFGLGMGEAPAQPWAQASLPLIVLAIGLPATLTTWRTERATGIRTPWRAAAALTGLGLLAFVLSLL